MSQVQIDLSKFANSVGFVFDSSLPMREPLATVFIVDEETVVTTAHSLVLYAEIVRALKIRFPASGKEYSVRSLTFHPRLDKAALLELAKHAFSELVPNIVLQEHNVAVLKLKPADPDLSALDVAEIDKHFGKFIPEREIGLDGDLSELELALVIQTVTNARKEGTISVFDERHRVVAKLFCINGKVSHASYGPLLNEFAICQIVNRRVGHSFHFSSEDEPEWASLAEIARPIDMLLIEAHRRLDEMEKLHSVVGGPSSLFEAIGKEPKLEVVPAGMQDHVKALWPFLDGAVRLGDLWQLCGLDDFTVYAVLQELIKTRQVGYFEPPFLRTKEAIEIPFALNAPLAPDDKVVALYVDDISMAPLMKHGTILGSVNQADPSRVLHDISLPAYATGTPIFKGSGVIGIHCGAVPREPLVVAPLGGFHQMIWIADILEVLQAKGEEKLVKRLTLSGEGDPVALGALAAEAGAAAGEGEEKQTETGSKKPLPGCREVAKVQCPKCGRTSLELANFCKGCGQRLMQDGSDKIGRKKRVSVPRRTGVSREESVFAAEEAAVAQVSKVSVLTALVLGIGLVALAGAAVFALPAPNIVQGPLFSGTDGPWITTGLSVNVKAGNKMVLEPVKGDNQGFVMPIGRPFILQEKINKPCRLYFIVKQASGSNVLICPKTPNEDKVFMSGEEFLLGLNGIEDPHVEQERACFQGDITGPKGSDKLILLCSGFRCRVTENPQLLDELVAKTQDMLSCDETGLGVETTVKEFGEKFFDLAPSKNAKVGMEGLIGQEVYLKEVEISYSRPAASLAPAPPKTSTVEVETVVRQ
jgi:hypothetical protein